MVATKTVNLGEKGHYLIEVDSETMELKVSTLQEPVNSLLPLYYLLAAVAAVCLIGVGVSFLLAAMESDPAKVSFASVVSDACPLPPCPLPKLSFEEVRSRPRWNPDALFHATVTCPGQLHAFNTAGLRQ